MQSIFLFLKFFFYLIITIWLIIRSATTMKFIFLKYLLCIFSFIYLVVSITIYYNETFNSLLFIVSFLTLMIELIKILLNQRTFHLIKYTVSRVKYHLTSKKQSNNIDSVVAFYAKNSESRPRQKFLLILSLTVFFETIIIAFFNQ